MGQLSDALRELVPERDFLVCIDSDGTVFDNMELKHKECFCPAVVNVWELQAVSRYVREAWEYVNLYSKSRGVNRFQALCQCMELLARRSEVARRGFAVPDLGALRRWVDGAEDLNPAALAAYAAKQPDEPVLQTALRWSGEVNANVERIVRNVSPFPDVKAALARLQGRADVVVVSDAPNATLTREWREHGLDQYVRVICGQEFGGKQACIALAMERGYDPGRVLMIGDAPRDRQAARACGVSINPINPTGEDASWRKFLEEGFGRFLSGTFSGAYEDMLCTAYDSILAPLPPWERGQAGPCPGDKSPAVPC